MKRAKLATDPEMSAITMISGFDGCGWRNFGSAGTPPYDNDARTVLRNPPVLVLDEATSALDVQTERAVQQALARLVEGRTTIAIAHRLSTIRDADWIVVLEHGRVVEQGTWTSLQAAKGSFDRLVHGLTA